MRQNPVGEPAATAAWNFGTPQRRSSLKRLCPFCECQHREDRGNSPRGDQTYEKGKNEKQQRHHLAYPLVTYGRERNREYYQALGDEHPGEC
jgi:hypothetical protein